MTWCCLQSNIPPNRRNTSESHGSDDNAKQPQQECQKTICYSIDIPVDEGLKEDTKVYTDDNKIVLDANLNQTTIGDIITRSKVCDLL